ncbi:MAG: hypothetical protein J6Q30_01750 [Oscillospiraceae bacterium]|nr:hypothetical protein [Oscillospiraceae bacterium]
MLYVTTTEKNDAYTAARTYFEDRGPDGGLFVPRQFPVFSAEELSALVKESFGERIAKILNMFFSTKLTGWDIDSGIGRCPVKAATMSHRILLLELWQNLDGSYEKLEKILAEKIRNDGNTEQRVSSWLRIAIRIALVFASFAELVRSKALDWETTVDVSVTSGDLSGIMTLWYARQMGFPVDNIICSCNENCALWDLLNHGELKTDIQTLHTTTPLADVGLPAELERLIYGTFGWDGAKEFLHVCRNKGLYVPPAEEFDRLRKGLFSAVVSRSRVDVLISSVYRTNSYLIGPYTALAYGGLTDYRAKTGESRTALILAQRSPAQDAAVVAEAMGMTEEQLLTQLR